MTKESMLARRKCSAAFQAVMGLLCLGRGYMYDVSLDSMSVVHAHVIFRHGQRSRLVKTVASEFGENAGVTLTPAGELECYDLGQNLRNRYVMENSSYDQTLISGIKDFDSDRVQIVSSGYDRTLESAAALALGLYPPDPTNDEEISMLPNKHIIVPVHSSDPENDVVILASNLCPVYDDNWQEVYRTYDFEEKEMEASSFIDDLYQTYQEQKAANKEQLSCTDEVNNLKENGLQYHAPYNLWDCALIELNEGTTEVQRLILNTPVPDTSLATDGWDYFEGVVFWIEDRKYEQSITGRMIGGLYVTEMYNRFIQVIDHINSGNSPTEGRYPGMHITAGHYPTLKGLAGCLDIGGLEGIPPTSSHMTFELIHNPEPNEGEGEEKFGVRILYQEGDDESTLRPLDLGVIFNADSTYDLETEIDYNNRDGDILWWSVWSFLLDHIVESGPAYYPGGQAEWCEDCQNDRSDTCLIVGLEDMTKRWEIAVSNSQDCQEEKEEVDDGVEGYHAALLSIFGVFFGIAVGICVQPCLARRNKRIKDNDLSISGNRGLESWGGRPRTGGIFRLGSRSRTPTRHVMVGGRSALGVHSAADFDDSMDGDDGDGEMGDGSRIPAFSATSPLGTPVPFPRGEAATSRVVKTAPSPTGDEGVVGGFNGISPTNGNADFSGGDSHGTQVDWEAEDDEDQEWGGSESKTAPLA